MWAIKCWGYHKTISGAGIELRTTGLKATLLTTGPTAKSIIALNLSSHHFYSVRKVEPIEIVTVMPVVATENVDLVVEHHCRMRMAGRGACLRI